MSIAVAAVPAVRAALYARYSSDQQRATSIDDQFRNCRRRADAEGWEIIREFSDAAISGSDASRPQYQAMLSAAAKREFDVLVVDDLSRLTRDSVEQERTIRRLEFHGQRIVATSDGYDSESKARKVHRGVKGLMNEIFLDDLRDKVHRGLTGQAHRRFWCGGKPYGYKLRPVTDPSQTDAYGQPVRIGTVLEIDTEQAAIVREIFRRFADGESYLTIARVLNERGVPSPGSTWRRKVRRCAGWMGSAVRVIIKNELYTGVVNWNTNRLVRDPDSGKHVRRARPQSEWVTFTDEALRIIDADLWSRSQKRTGVIGNNDSRLKSGGKARYLLSGLLKCSRCGAHLVMGDVRSYCCSSFVNGRACGHGTRVRREQLEAKILEPVWRDLLAPARVAKMAKEIEAGYAKRMQEMSARAESAPKELQELDARLVRLRARLQAGDPDMTADEIQAAVDKAEAKRRELQASLPEARQTAKVLSLLPKAAEIYRKQIEQGLAGEPRAAAKARIILRDMLGPITVDTDEAGSVWASYRMNPAALVKAAGTDGRGDRI